MRFPGPALPPGSLPLSSVPAPARTSAGPQPRGPAEQGGGRGDAAQPFPVCTARGPDHDPGRARGHGILPTGPGRRPVAGPLAPAAAAAPRLGPHVNYVAQFVTQKRCRVGARCRGGCAETGRSPPHFTPKRGRHQGTCGMVRGRRALTGPLWQIRVPKWAVYFNAQTCTFLFTSVLLQISGRAGAWVCLFRPHPVHICAGAPGHLTPTDEASAGDGP